MSQDEKDFLKAQIGDTVYFEKSSHEVLDFRKVGDTIQVKLHDSIGWQWVNLNKVLSYAM